jgi:hypothetical protein
LCVDDQNLTGISHADGLEFLYVYRTAPIFEGAVP